MLDKDAVLSRLEKLGIEAQEAAHRARMSKQVWSNVMHGSGNVRAETLAAMAYALQCTPCELLMKGTVIPPRPKPKLKRGGK